MNFIKKHLPRCYRLLLPFLIFSATVPIKAQLGLNDTCPDAELREVIGSSQMMKLSDFAGKSVIIDFWNTKCLSCIKSFPKLTALQKTFGDKLVIVLATRESKDVVEAFFSKHKKVERPQVIMVVGDTVLHLLFPSDGYPYSVWLDGKRLVKQLTGGYNLTVDNARKFVENEQLSLRYAAVKTVYKPMWDLGDSTFKKQILYYSALTPCIPNLNISVADYKSFNDGRSSSISCNCCTIIDLYKKAYGEGGKIPLNSQYSVDVKNNRGLELNYPEDGGLKDAWLLQNTYNYQLVIPSEKTPERYRIMQGDLATKLPLSAKLVRKKVQGYELVKITGKFIRNSNSSVVKDAYNDMGGLDDDSLTFKGITIDRLSYLVSSWCRYWAPFQSSINGGSRIDFTIRQSALGPLNVDELRRELKKVNLDLKEVFAEVDVLEIE